MNRALKCRMAIEKGVNTIISHYRVPHSTFKYRTVSFVSVLKNNDFKIQRNNVFKINWVYIMQA